MECAHARSARAALIILPAAILLVLTSTWRGSRLRTIIKGKVVARVRTMDVEYEELRYLDRDGRMIVETSVRSARGGGRRRAVYNRSN